MTTYRYRVVKIKELPNVQQEVHYERGASLAHLASLVYAIKEGVASEEALEHGIYFTPLEEHRFTDAGLKFNNDLVIWREEVIPMGSRGNATRLI